MKTKVCRSCGYVGKPEYDAPMTFMLDALVWVFGIVVGTITFGMLLIAVSILNFAVQIYFPQQPRGTVELKVVNVKTVEKPKKRVKRSRKKKK